MAKFTRNYIMIRKESEFCTAKFAYSLGKYM